MGGQRAFPVVGQGRGGGGLPVTFEDNGFFRPFAAMGRGCWQAGWYPKGLAVVAWLLPQCTLAVTTTNLGIHSLNLAHQMSLTEHS
jgi:hypothetical protein